MMSEERVTYKTNEEAEEPEPVEVTISAESMDILQTEAKKHGITIDQVIDKLCAGLNESDQNGTS